MLDSTDPSGKPGYGVGFIEAGVGSPVMLVHSSMAGARQRSAVMHDLQDRAHVRAVNLFGYGSTPPWQEAKPPSLDGYTALIARAVPASASSPASTKAVAV